MIQPVVPEGSAKVLLFVLLTGLMVLAGTHLLETICYSFFGTNVNVDKGDSGSGVHFRIREEGTLGLIHTGYRYLISTLFLVLGYHGLGLRPWARTWLIRVLLLDLGAWLLHALRYLFIRPVFVLSHEQIVLEILAVAFEGGLLWILLQPASEGHFARREKRSSIAA